MRASFLIGIVVCCALVTACNDAARGTSSLRIQKLSGFAVRLGSWSGYPLYGVRLKATACDDSPAEGGTYPDEIRITHFAVSRSPASWLAQRTASDVPHWLVPLDETWRGKQCGPVLLEDAIPPDQYVIESLGNPNVCYGVSLTIKADGREASRRAIITCRLADVSRIRLGVGIGSVQLLMTRAQVESRLDRGEPSSNPARIFNTYGRSVFYPGAQLLVLYGTASSFAPPGSVRRVVGIATASDSYSIGDVGPSVGTRIDEIESRFPRAECYPKTGCWLRAPRGTYYRPTTVFLARNGVVRRVVVQFTEFERS